MIEAIITIVILLISIPIVIASLYYKKLIWDEIIFKDNIEKQNSLK